MQNMWMSLVLSITVAAAGCSVEGEPVVDESTQPLVLPDGEAITGASLPAGTISLTYDDGPGRNSIDIAFYLWQQGIQATFFINGCRFQGRPQPMIGNCSTQVQPEFYPPWVLGVLVALGHRVANHTQDHEGLGSLAVRDSLDPWQRAVAVRDQLLPLQTMLDEFINDDLRMVRSAGGNWNAEAARVINMFPQLRSLVGQIHWNIEPRYGVPPGAPPRAERAMCALPCPEPGMCGVTPCEGQAQDWHCLGRGNAPAICAEEYLDEMPADRSFRGIVVLHDREQFTEANDSADDDDYTLRLTKYLVPRLRARGYTFVPLDAVPGVLSPRRLTGTRAQRWTSDFGNGDRWDDEPSLYASIRLANVDGRGGMDICGRRADGIYCALSTDEGFAPMTRWTHHFSDGQGYRPAKNGATVQFGDLDGDGADDVCVRNESGLRCAISLPGAQRFSTPRKWSAGSDLSDARGWGDEWSNFGSIRLAHLDDDELIDMCARSNDGIACALNTGGQFESMTTWKGDDFGNGNGYRPAQYGQTMQLGDIDGDGRADVCVRAILGARCALNRGHRSFGPSHEWTHGPFSDHDGWSDRSNYRSFHLADINGDGEADLCGRAPTGLVCAFADRGKFRTYQYVMNTDLRDSDGWRRSDTGGTVLFGDVDGDGVGDACGRSPSGIYCALGRDELRAAP